MMWSELPIGTVIGIIFDKNEENRLENTRWFEVKIGKFTYITVYGRCWIAGDSFNDDAGNIDVFRSDKEIDNNRFYIAPKWIQDLFMEVEE